jgi:hypothetical protein
MRTWRIGRERLRAARDDASGERWAPPRPGQLALQLSGQPEQPLLAVLGRDQLRADRQAVARRRRGIEIAGWPVMSQIG